MPAEALRSLLLPVVALGSLAAAGCEDSFEPYEDVQEPRLLAIAAGSPDVLPGATTTLSALLTDPAASTRWSWCPLVGSQDEGYPCLVPHERLQAEVDLALGNDQLLVPAYDLGTGATAELSHVLPPQVWETVCSALQSGEVSSVFEFPRCDEGFPVTVRLEVALGEREIVGIRTVRLLYDADAPVNSNPVLGPILATELGLGTTIPLDNLGTAELARDTQYELNIELAESESERYQRDPLTGEPLEEAREILRLSWFHEGGELDASATSFNEGATALIDASTNEWRTPTTDERSDTSSRLFVIIRDDRGGTSWLTSNVRFNR